MLKSAIMVCKKASMITVNNDGGHNDDHDEHDANEDHINSDEVVYNAY
jgi:hypothetical protein